ncbi:helix-turn-helix domain-containing protein [Nocardioides sp. AE5]|uniref:helix-turn-helix domain-containing protein n=1 Tax=Nocardioides sp. AE5 TaxID=2962573 RepID=UPI002881830B|nr:helix-turn-helix domain-containing protein [Nocardioides sp. AE5]MDT0202504.1 helix-turn-helix domain-containing protein [Nocardioides sp. AE5]
MRRHLNGVVFLVFARQDGPMAVDRDLLSTGETATRLGVSRQQVVNLCDRGELEHVMVGKHRRIPVREVNRLLRPSLTREQEKSLWLHRALMTPLLTAPQEVIDHAFENITRWKGAHRPDGVTVRHLGRWEQILEQGLDAVMETIVSPSPEACELRQNTPFAGILDDMTRAQVLRNFNDHWNREHQSA